MFHFLFGFTLDFCLFVFFYFLELRYFIHVSCHYHSDFLKNTCIWKCVFYPINIRTFSLAISFSNMRTLSYGSAFTLLLQNLEVWAYLLQKQFLISVLLAPVSGGPSSGSEFTLLNLEASPAWDFSLKSCQGYQFTSTMPQCGLEVLVYHPHSVCLETKVPLVPPVNRPGLTLRTIFNKSNLSRSL